ncbi:hypothetical protein GCM10027184_50830 [Saccharothrix stipae]
MIVRLFDEAEWPERPRVPPLEAEPGPTADSFRFWVPARLADDLATRLRRAGIRSGPGPEDSRGSLLDRLVEVVPGDGFWASVADVVIDFLRRHGAGGASAVVVNRREHPLADLSTAEVRDTVASLLRGAHEERAEWFRRLLGTPKGERRAPGTHNEATGEVRNLVQAGAIHGGVHFYGSAAEHDEPVIVTVDVRRTSDHFVVDGDPEGLVLLSDYASITVTVEGRGARAVVLQDLKPVVVARREPRLAVRRRPPTVNAMMLPVRPVEVDLTAAELRLKAEDLYFSTDLREDAPHVRARGTSSYGPQDRVVPVLPRGGFPYAVTASDPEQFVVTPTVAGQEVDWELHLEWLHAGRRGTTVVDDGGRPFQLYPNSGAIPDEYETEHDPLFRELRRRLLDGPGRHW